MVHLLPATSEKTWRRPLLHHLRPVDLLSHERVATVLSTVTPLLLNLVGANDRRKSENLVRCSNIYAISAGDVPPIMSGPNRNRKARRRPKRKDLPKYDAKFEVSFIYW